jgi:hypothetical protein
MVENWNQCFDEWQGLPSIGSPLNAGSEHLGMPASEAYQHKLSRCQKGK